MPSLRCGRGHIFNNYYEKSSDGIEARVGAHLLVYVSSFPEAWVSGTNVWQWEQRLFQCFEACLRQQRFCLARGEWPWWRVQHCPWGYILNATVHLLSRRYFQRQEHCHRWCWRQTFLLSICSKLLRIPEFEYHDFFSLLSRIHSLPKVSGTPNKEDHRIIRYISNCQGEEENIIYINR